MNKAKRTISRDSVFRDVNALETRGIESTRGTRDEVQGVTQGLPHEETRTRQTAVWLGDEEIEWLDNQTRTIQRGGWRGVTRSALIRSLIRSASEHHVDLSGTTGEVEIAERLTSK